MTDNDSLESSDDTMVRVLLGRKYVPLWYFKNYKSSMTCLLKRKDRKIKELEEERNTLLRTLIKKNKEEYEDK